MVLALLLAAAIFVFDTFVALQISAAVLYVLVLVIAESARKRTPIAAIACTCSALAILSFVIDHGTEPEPGAALRLSISLGAIALTAALLIKNRRTLASLREHDQRYKTIFDTAAVAFWDHDFSDIEKEIERLRKGGVDNLRAYLEANPGEIRRMRRTVTVGNANNTALRLLKVPNDESFFTHLSEFLPDEDGSFLHGILAVAERRSGFETETRFRAYDGSWVEVFVNLTFPSDSEGWDRVFGSIMDVTERRRMQSTLEQTRTELAEAMRSAAVGELTASITHEVSQPLFAIRAQVEAARRWLSRTPPALEETGRALDEVRAAALEAANVIHQVRRITRPAPPRRDVVDLGLIALECAILARRQFPGTSFEIQNDLDDAKIEGDATALRHLLINLLKNSSEAMDAAGATERWVRILLDRSAGQVRVSITDGGPGFPAEVLVHPFEPTIPISGGRLGVGLPMSRSIVRGHDGQIELQNLSPVGAKVSMAFPRH